MEATERVRNAPAGPMPRRRSGRARTWLGGGINGNERLTAGDPVYRHKGPPETLLRLLAPAVVLSTVVVFATGVVMLFEGPSHRGLLLLAHKASFILWLGATGLHVLGHLPRLGKSLLVARPNANLEGLSPGAAGRSLAVVGALVGGVVLAVVLIPDCSAWTAHGVFMHHHNHD